MSLSAYIFPEYGAEEKRFGKCHLSHPISKSCLTLREVTRHIGRRVGHISTVFTPACHLDPYCSYTCVFNLMTNNVASCSLLLLPPLDGQWHHILSIDQDLHLSPGSQCTRSLRSVHVHCLPYNITLLARLFCGVIIPQSLFLTFRQ